MLRSAGTSQITRRILGSLEFLVVYMWCFFGQEMKRQIVLAKDVQRKYNRPNLQNPKSLWKSLVQLSLPPSIAIRINTAAIGRLFHRPKASHWSSLHLHPSSLPVKTECFQCFKWLVAVQSSHLPLIPTYINWKGMGAMGHTSTDKEIRFVKVDEKWSAESYRTNPSNNSST